MTEKTENAQSVDFAGIYLPVLIFMHTAECCGQARRQTGSKRWRTVQAINNSQRVDWQHAEPRGGGGISKVNGIHALIGGSTRGSLGRLEQIRRRYCSQLVHWMTQQEARLRWGNGSRRRRCRDKVLTSTKQVKEYFGGWGDKINGIWWRICEMIDCC